MKMLLAVVLACWSVLVWGQAAGTVDLVDGDVRIYDAARSARTAKIGDSIKEGESVVTGADSELHLVMADGGQLAIRPNTRLLIEKYKADGGADDRSVIGLLQGAMRSVTGWIGKFSPKNYQIRTPTATIGVRGTDHETHVIPPGSKDGEAGTYDKVNVGSTLLKTPQGTTEVRPNQAGFAAHFGKQRPALLSAVPTFFRPGRHESRFADLHEKVHKQLEQRRNERLQKVREMRTQVDTLKAGRKLEHQNEKLQQREQRLQQRQERRMRSEARGGREPVGHLRRNAGNDGLGDFRSAEKLRRPQAERRHLPDSEHRREFGAGEGGGGHRRH